MPTPTIQSLAHVPDDSNAKSPSRSSAISHLSQPHQLALQSTELATQESSISCLPTEILQKIFQSAIEWSRYSDAWFTDSPWWKGHRFTGVQMCSEHECHEYELMWGHERRRLPGYVPHGTRFGDMNQSPWNVSQVCRYWRDVALATPHLWTYIEIDSDWDIWEKRKKTHFAPFLDIAVTRSLPYGINLLLTGVDTLSEIKRFVIPQLVVHCRRWRRIFSMDTVNTHFVVEKRMAPELPLLKNVAIFCDIFSHETSLPNLETLYHLRPAPRPRFDSTFLRYGPLISGLSCQIKVRGEESANCIQELLKIAAMPRLRTLRLTLDEYRRSIDPSIWAEVGSRIQLPAVRDLSLGIGSAADSSAHSLTLISTPSLQILHLLSLDVPKPLIDLISYSGCSLSSLRIDDTALDSTDLLELLRHTPRLEVLHLTFIAISRAPHWKKTDLIGMIGAEVLENLFNPDKTILPLLRRISLLNLNELNLDHMLEVLRQRSKKGSLASLEHVHVSLPGFEMSPRHRELLRYFRCQYRLCIEIGPWNLYYEDSSSDEESEAQSTSVGDDLGESEFESDESESGVNQIFDWHGPLIFDEDSSDDYESSGSSRSSMSTETI